VLSTQNESVPQLMPQAPQWFSSVRVSSQPGAGSQSASGSAHVAAQDDAMHVSPPVQRMPQPPQLALSVLVSVSQVAGEPSQSRIGNVQLEPPQTPPPQAKPPEQTVAQSPQ